MKTPPCFLLGLFLALTPFLSAQDHDALTQDPGARPLLQPAQLDQLLGPIALYPDALVALILPAATEPADLVLAARYLAADADSSPEAIAAQPWDDSVKSLARYPDLLQWMDTNLAWTKQLGEAFLAQPAEVLKAVQRLRTLAQAAGTLTDTPQQTVVVETEYIRIVPAQPDVIYVPYYDPLTVFTPRPIFFFPPPITFVAVGPIGLWLVYECDWDHRIIWVVDRRRERRPPSVWLNPVVVVNHPSRPGDPARSPWQPPSRVASPRPGGFRLTGEIIRPAPVVFNTPHRPDDRSHAAVGNTLSLRPGSAQNVTAQPLLARPDPRGPGRQTAPAPLPPAAPPVLATASVSVPPAPVTAQPATLPPPARPHDERPHDAANRPPPPVLTSNATLPALLPRSALHEFSPPASPGPALDPVRPVVMPATVRPVAALPPAMPTRPAPFEASRQILPPSVAFAPPVAALPPAPPAIRPVPVPPSPVSDKKGNDPDKDKPDDRHQRT